MKNYIAVLTLIATLGLASTTLANPKTPQPPQEENLEIILKAEGILPASDKIVKIPLKFSEIPKALMDQLIDSAKYSVMIWSDTILEGDYHAKDEARLDKVEEVRNQKGQLLGYRLTYSAEAWETSDCKYDSQHDSTLAGCKKGRIVEIGFVSTDMKQSAQEKAAEFF